MKKKSVIGDIAAVVIGSVLYGLAVNMFLVPDSIVVGGATGIATVLYALFRLPVGIMIAALNVPLFIISFVSGGRDGIFRALTGTAAVSVATELLSHLPSPGGDTLTCALIGGAVMGIGSGILITRGFTTGGSDLAAYLIRNKLRRLPGPMGELSVGRTVLIIDMIIIVGAAVVLRSYTGIVYSVITSVAYSAAFDMVHHSSFRARTIFIVSKKYAEIADTITKVSERGVTALPGRGWYTGDDVTVLMCVVTRSEEYAVCEIVKRADPSAFIIIGEASGVIGEGFRDSLKG